MWSLFRTALGMWLSIRRLCFAGNRQAGLLKFLRSRGPLYLCEVLRALEDFIEKRNKDKCDVEPSKQSKREHDDSDGGAEGVAAPSSAHHFSSLLWITDAPLPPSFATVAVPPLPRVPGHVEESHGLDFFSFEENDGVMLEIPAHEEPRAPDPRPAVAAKLCVYNLGSADGMMHVAFVLHVDRQTGHAQFLKSFVEKFLNMISGPVDDTSRCPVVLDFVQGDQNGVSVVRNADCQWDQGAEFLRSFFKVAGETVRAPCDLFQTLVGPHSDEVHNWYFAVAGRISRKGFSRNGT
jgi:hypothetical protein